jgi:SWI/SNF-related matrix-associated actin-dependent regulator 1 of chromatin subfamily A
VPLGKYSHPTLLDSVICSFDYAAEHTEQLLRGRWDLLILDEAHFLKSLEAKRSRKILGRQGLVHFADRVWALSGTPAPNHAGELWPLLYTFGATKLSYSQFVETFCETRPTPYGIQVTGTKKNLLADLKKLLSAIMLRRRKEEVMSELPPIFYSDLVVEPGEVKLEDESSFMQYVFPIDRRGELEERLAKERALLEQMVDLTGFTKDGMKGLEALAQSVSTLRRYTGLQKVEPIAELVAEELESAAYGKVVIFAIHRDVIEGLRVRLSKYGAVTLYGGTDPEKRQKNVDKFQNSDKTRVFIGNILAAGTAINLTAAHQVIFAEQDWVPGNNGAGSHAVPPHRANASGQRPICWIIQ